MYLSRAEKYDKECAESWKADEDGILIYVHWHTDFLFISCEKLGQIGLFSAM